MILTEIDIIYLNKYINETDCILSNRTRISRVNKHFIVGVCKILRRELTVTFSLELSTVVIQFH